MDSVQEAYRKRAAEYIERLGSIDATAEDDRRLVRSWARGLPKGLVLDVGCGPGHWTHWLRLQGVKVAGIDPAQEFIAHARQHYPDADFRLGRAEHLDHADGSLAGILAWYSLIHLPPPCIPDVLAEFARALKPNGGLLLGFFTGDKVEPFDHQVTTAYYWPVDELEQLVRDAGFDVLRKETRKDTDARSHGAISARRSAGSGNGSRRAGTDGGS
ncbi:MULTISPECIES: class I SAM-dependent methyltransferase [Thermocrispum]|uniref:Class I SAM-dependent methyltransferase n=1 Tax=Thermocrispum agreste TaxID=37925 RepID=A0A2W4KWR0_9PSEU|nr:MULTISPECIES: class I SAM-dependent methyltransferase [Thermocrispum]PZM93049.1 MAG: class I SAM-dependent methyltransferase [Thermocrispum agreste]